MISSNDFRPGVHVVLDGDLYRVIESSHVKLGRGSAYVKAKVRNMKTGSITERTFRAGERVPQAYLDKRPAQYLYAAGEERVVMEHETFEQHHISASLLGEGVRFLREGMDVVVVFFEGRPIDVELPNSVVLRITEAPPGVRGDTATGGNKPATLETGAVVQVPLFVEAGELVRVDTRTGHYLERVRE